MKKQFNIKPAQLIKDITKAVTKTESSNFLKFASLADDRCCADYTLTRDIVALPR